MRVVRYILAGICIYFVLAGLVFKVLLAGELFWLLIVAFFGGLAWAAWPKKRKKQAETA